MSNNINNSVDEPSITGYTQSNNISNTSPFPTSPSVYEDKASLLSLDSFFENCRKISESGQYIYAALNDISHFKDAISNALDRKITTQEELKAAFEEIKPLLDFWSKFGETFAGHITCSDDAIKMLSCFNNFPDLERKNTELNNKLAEKESQIDALQENEINKQLSAANATISALREDLSHQQEALTQSQRESEDLSAKLERLKIELDNLRSEKQRILEESESEKQRISKESEAIKEKFALEQSSYQDEIERLKNEVDKLKNVLENKSSEAEGFQIIRGLVADAFKIDTRTESEFAEAIATAKKILRACIELDRNAPPNENVIDRIEEIAKDNERLKEQDVKIASLEDSMANLNSRLKQKDVQIYEQDQKIQQANNSIESLSDEKERYKQEVDNLGSEKQKLLKQNDDYSSALEIRKNIIQCFMDISDEIETTINAIENSESDSDNLQRLKSILNEICEQYTRMTDIDELAREFDISSLDSSKMRDVFTKFTDFDQIKQFHDIYLGFISRIMKTRRMQWASSYEPGEQEQLLETFSQEYKRILVLCQAFEDYNYSQSASLDIERLESHQAEMFSAIENFFHYAIKSTNDSSINKGTTLYEKIALLPSVQGKLSSAIESAVFSINYSKTKIEEFDELQKLLNELQLKYEKQCNVLNMLEKKLYPNFMTSQNLGRREKLIDDIEFGLTADSAQALLLKSYLGLLSFAEKDNDTISDETMIWILQQLPKALYIFYQNTILDGASDISSDEEIYEVMNQLMNRINKFILKGTFFLSMPRLGSSITLDSMEVLEKTTSVNAVISWMISDSHHKIIHKALVK